MSILAKIKSLVTDPPPEYAFEVSESGIAWAATEGPVSPQWRPLDAGVVQVTPLVDNVKRPDAYAAAVASLVPMNGAKKPRRAALILPDFCARVSVLDFDTFPSDPEEQLALVRFRVKKAVPFDVESAVVACFPQQRSGEKRIDVTVAVLNVEVAAHYEAPFKAAGYQCGFVTLSALAALPLQADSPAPPDAPSVTVKLSGRVLAVALTQNKSLRMFRCVELPEANVDELLEVLGPTFAYAEDEYKMRPKTLRLCGFPRIAEDRLQHWSRELGMDLAFVTSRLGAVSANNAGLLGYLETVEAG
jgi:type IV pilus assembly protein PilM